MGAMRCGNADSEARLRAHVLAANTEKPNAAQTIAWKCAYHVLLAHAAAVKRFRSAVPGGKISMNINSDWGEPYSSSAQDKVGFSPKRQNPPIF